MYNIKASNEYVKWSNSIKDKKLLGLIDKELGRLTIGLFSKVSRVFNQHGSIKELKVHYGPGYRIYFEIVCGTIILFYGGMKKTYKNQNSDITKALMIAKEFVKL